MASNNELVRYVFRHDDPDVEIVIEGELEWLSQVLETMDLSQVGWIQPLLDTSSLISEESEESRDLGPAPDPSKIPVVRRMIGELDVLSKIDELGLLEPESPTVDDLQYELSCIETPPPAEGPLIIDPMAEAWLRELMRIAVRNYGISFLPVEMIEESCSDKLGDRKGMELEFWLEKLFRSGKLVKVHGGDHLGYGPNPSWLQNRMSKVVEEEEEEQSEEAVDSE